MTQNAVALMPHRVIDSQPKGWAATLVIGDMEDWRAKGRTVPNIDGFHFADATDVNAAFVRDLAPMFILSSLVANNFDAFEIARTLENMGYAGSYRVLANDIPDTDLIVAEVKDIAPRLDFDIIDLTEVFPGL